MPACFWPEAAISRPWGLVEWVGPCWVHPSRCDDSRTPTVSQEPGAGQEPVAKAGATADPSSREIPRSRDCPNHTSNTVPQRFPTLLQRLDASLRLICAEKNRIRHPTDHNHQFCALSNRACSCREPPPFAATISSTPNSSPHPSISLSRPTPPVVTDATSAILWPGMKALGLSSCRRLDRS